MNDSNHSAINLQHFLKRKNLKFRVCGLQNMYYVGQIFEISYLESEQQQKCAACPWS